MMRFSSMLAGTAALAALIGGNPALAWGPEGHAIVADIAEAHLTPAAATQVARLLALENHQTLDQVASWADAIRSSQPDTAPWHFVDIPLEADSYDPARDCAGGNCVINKIAEFTAVLANPSSPDADRLTALKWVVHFVGDVHQPLHAEDHDDKGGNTVHLTYFGKSTNLHAVWDGGIIEKATGLRVGPNFSIDPDAVATVARTLDSQITLGQRQTWAQAGLLPNLQPAVIQWALDTHRLAQNFAYPSLPAQRSGNWAVAYQSQAWPIVELQLEEAGVRLAEILNEALP